MINLIIGKREEAVECLTKLILSHHGGFSARVSLLKCQKEKVLKLAKENDIIIIQELDRHLLFEEIIEWLEEISKNKCDVMAITYRDDIIEAYEDVEDVNIIDLRGE